MKGTIELLTGRVPTHKKTLSWYSKEECRSIYNRWRNEYEDAVIQIWPEPGPCCIELPDSQVINMDINTKRPVINKVEKKVLREIEIPDYVIDQGLKHETYFHRCYCKGEK